MSTPREEDGGDLLNKLEIEDRKDDDEICYEPTEEHMVAWLVEAMRDHQRMKQARAVVLNRHFGELTISANLEEQEKLLLINEYINKEFVYPAVFLGSSLGFNKNNWNKNIEKLLERFEIKQKAVLGVKENCFLFEKLKYLVLKYMERGRK